MFFSPSKSMRGYFRIMKCTKYVRSPMAPRHLLPESRTCSSIAGTFSSIAAPGSQPRKLTVLYSSIPLVSKPRFISRFQRRHEHTQQQRTLGAQRFSIFLVVQILQRLVRGPDDGPRSHRKGSGVQGALPGNQAQSGRGPRRERN